MPRKSSSLAVMKCNLVKLPLTTLFAAYLAITGGKVFDLYVRIWVTKTCLLSFISEKTNFSKAL